MSQLVFQEDITIFENNNFLGSQHRSLAAFPRQREAKMFSGNVCRVLSRAFTTPWSQPGSRIDDSLDDSLVTTNFFVVRLAKVAVV